MENSRVEKRRAFIINTVYFAIIAILVLLGVRYVLSWVMPFIIGFFIAFISKPAVKGLCKVTHMNRKLSATIVLILEYAAIVFLFWSLGAKIYESLVGLFASLPKYYDETILPFINKLVIMVEDISSRISPEVMDEIYSTIESASASIRSSVFKLSSTVVERLAGVTVKVPFFFISFVFTILASVFFSLDYDAVVGFIKKQLPQKARVLLSDAKIYTVKTVCGYLRAYLIIWVITFIELSIGFSILGVNNVLGLAALIALFDVLPVLGTGGVLLPWAIISLILQNYFLAAGLVVLYLVILAIRNFIEPKIIGDQLGLNPLVTIFAIYLGYRIIGLSGMIIFPIATNILVGLHKSGRLKLWVE